MRRGVAARIDGWAATQRWADEAEGDDASNTTKLSAVWNDQTGIGLKRRAKWIGK
jgi:hypothetical protein